MSQNESFFLSTPAIVSIDYAGIHTRARKAIDRYAGLYHRHHGRAIEPAQRHLLQISTIAGMTWRVVSNQAHPQGEEIHFDTANDLRFTHGRPPLRRKNQTQHPTI